MTGAVGHTASLDGSPGTGTPVGSAAKAEPPRGKLPVLKMPDPAFNLGRLKARLPTGLLSRRPREARQGERQFLVNEVGPSIKQGSFVWAVVALGKPQETKDLAQLPERLRDGIDRFSRAEFSAEPGPLFYVPMTLVAELDPPIKLRRAPSGRRFATAIDLERERATKTDESVPTDALILSPCSMAEAVVDGTKRLVVKSRKFNLASRELLLVTEKQALGIIELGEVEELSLAELRKREREHLITEALRRQFCKAQPSWCDAPYYAWKIERVVTFDRPRETNIGRGPQVLARNVRLKGDPIEGSVDLDKAGVDDLKQAQALSTSLAEGMPGFVKRTMRFIRGPTAVVELLRSLPGIMQRLARALRSIDVGELAKQDTRKGVVVTARELLKLLRRLRSQLKGGPSAILSTIDEGVEALERLEDLSRELVTRGEDVSELGQSAAKREVIAVDPTLLQQQSDEELQRTDARLHDLFAESFASTDRTTLDGLTREDVVNAEIFVQEEFERRGLEHTRQDELAIEAERVRMSKIDDRQEVYARAIGASGEAE